MQTIKIGLLGFGQIGSGCYTLLKMRSRDLAQQCGVRFQVKKIAVRNLRKKRQVKVPAGLLTTDAMSIVRDPDIDIVVELIGGVTDARKLVREALLRGKHVVTANKALLAEHGDEIFELACRRKSWLLFEASVGGGIPVIKALREGLVANRIDSIHSIINGTSNYILTRMSEDHMDFSEALKLAQAKGYAEADPRLDIEGIDAQHKLAILVRFAFGGRVKFKDIHCEGIATIRKEDIEFAEEFGYRIKLLAIAKRGHTGIEARVQPTLLPKEHILANVNGAFNAVLLRGDAVGDVLLYGRGAGSLPTASAVVSDLVDIAKRGTDRFADLTLVMRAIRSELRVASISTILSRYYLRFHITDQPGVLSKISHVLGKYGISISDCVQKIRSQGSVVPLILLTHEAPERSVREAIGVIDRLRVVRGPSQVIRIESGSPQ